MAYVGTATCVSCGDQFTVIGPVTMHCPACLRARVGRQAFGESEAADRWLAMLHPDVLEQEQRCQAHRDRLQAAFAKIVESRGALPDEFTDS